MGRRRDMMEDGGRMTNDECKMTNDVTIQTVDGKLAKKQGVRRGVRPGAHPVFSLFFNQQFPFTNSPAL